MNPMGYAVLDPRKREFNELTVRNGRTFQIEEPAGVGVPLSELGADFVPASDPEAPIRHGCVETGVVCKDVWRHVAGFDARQEAVDNRFGY